MRKRRRRTVVSTVTAAVWSLLSVLLALAVNQASAGVRWPGWLDFLLRYPWLSVGVLAMIGVIVVVITAIRDQSVPGGATTDDVLDVANRLHERLDTAERDRRDLDDRLGALPPYVQDLMPSQIGDRVAVWRIVAPFADDAVDPVVVAREWAASPPAALEGMTATGRLHPHTSSIPA
ncbi:hypothetical protein ACFQ1S_15415 [Kibdelosporangium lantanae]|uniref:Uncharacterized protein n=1 Tax=Kibdelosporangium lantanae TaxID=1497396 RepID=A0ABW3M8J6_9PSEU